MGIKSINLRGICDEDFLATRPIPAGTLVDTSPVILFERDNYETHGKHTIVADYVFAWGEGRMALALGLGWSIVSQ